MRKTVGVICIKVVVQGKGRDESTEGVVNIVKSRGPRGRSLGEHHKRRYTSTRKCYYI